MNEHKWVSLSISFPGLLFHVLLGPLLLMLLFLPITSRVLPMMTQLSLSSVLFERHLDLCCLVQAFHDLGAYLLMPLAAGLPFLMPSDTCT